MSDYVESLQDGRLIWLDGKKLNNFEEHVAFKGTLKTIDILLKDIDENKKVGFWDELVHQNIHRAFFIPRTKEDLVRRREAFESWSTKTYGVMSRLSDYAYSLITGYYIDRHEFNQYDPLFSSKIEKYFDLVRKERRLITTAIADPQIDRSKPLEKRDEDALLRVIKETDEGVIVRGAKMIATGAPYVHDVIVNTPFGDDSKENQYANFFIVPLNAKGLHIICRESYAQADEKKYPISSRFDEMDAVLIFDDVLIPWDRVFIRGSAKGAVKAHQHQQFNSLAHHQTVVRLLTKLRFVAGVATAIAQSIGADFHLHVQEKLGELYTQIDSIEGLIISAESNGYLHENGVFYPDSIPLQVARNLGATYYSEALNIVKQIGAGGFTQLPSEMIENFDKTLHPLLEKYYKGAKVDAKVKTALFRIGWELVGSTLGARHDLYERYYTGDPVRIKALFFEQYDKRKLEQRLSHYIEKLTKEGEIHEAII